jgi:hypothetical protein
LSRSRRTPHHRISSPDSRLYWPFVGARCAVVAPSSITPFFVSKPSAPSCLRSHVAVRPSHPSTPAGPHRSGFEPFRRSPLSRHHHALVSPAPHCHLCSVSRRLGHLVRCVRLVPGKLTVEASSSCGRRRAAVGRATSPSCTRSHAPVRAPALCLSSTLGPARACACRRPP